MQNKTIAVRELDIDSIRPNAESVKTNIGGTKLCIIGKPGSGKSVLIKWILYRKSSTIPVGLVISGSEDSNHFYAGMFPDLFIHNKYEKRIIESFIARQKLAKEYLPNPWSVLVLDDCMDDVKVFNDPLIVGLFKNSRHWDTLSIFACQYVFDFKPAIRTNIDGVFIFREPNQSNRKKIYENFASVVPDFATFCQMMNELTTDFTCIYINNQIQSNTWTDCVFWVKADQVPDFKFGSEEYWRFAQDRGVKTD
jgi:hypothetical protein